jgi:hypothetical protein
MIAYWYIHFWPGDKKAISSGFAKAKELALNESRHFPFDKPLQAFSCKGLEYFIRMASSSFFCTGFVM